MPKKDVENIELKVSSDQNIDDSSSVWENSTPQTILVDDFEADPTQNFESLSKTISKIIKESIPHFTIGVYGDWGTGKTTLMKSIERYLNDIGIYDSEQRIVTVWFNAWRYEHEETLATQSLMKTVAYALENHKKFDSVSKTISNGLNYVGSEIAPELALDLIKNGGYNQKEIEQNLAKKISSINNLQRSSIYFDGLAAIKRQMNLVRQRNDDIYRIVVFIDDLDRCSPKKALEILESIKLFLDMEGFVFVIGMSHKTGSQLVSHMYKSTGIKGEDYIKKIIQIPIKIPKWSQENIAELIETKIAPRLGDDYATFLKQNPSVVSQVVDSNPRQLKRFINNVIIAFETFTRKNGPSNITLNEIYLVQVLKAEWPDFYDHFSKNSNFRKLMRWAIEEPKDLKKYFKYLQFPEDEFPQVQKQKRMELLSAVFGSSGAMTSSQIDILSEFNYSTWTFLQNVKGILYGIDDWKVLDSVMDVIEELPYNVHLKPKKRKDTVVQQPPPEPQNPDLD